MFYSIHTPNAVAARQTRKRMAGLAVVFSILLAGCGHMPKANKDERVRISPHVLYINQSGDLLQPENGSYAGTSDPSEEPTLAQRALSERAYVDDLIANLMARYKKGEVSELVIFIHGGLNTYGNVIDRAVDLTTVMANEGGATQKAKPYPVFIGWDSSFGSNIYDHYFRVRRGQYEPGRAVATSWIVAGEDVLRSIGRAPYALYKEFADALTVCYICGSTSKEEDYTARVRRLKAMNEIKIHSGGPYRGVRGDYAYFWNPIKLVAAPLRDGLGTPAWNAMLRRSDLVLSRAAAYEGTIPKEMRAAGAPASVAEQAAATSGEGIPYFGDTAVAYFFSRLEQEQADADKQMRRPKGELNGLKINLIGHSMGTIVANSILARRKDLKVENLVYMGAAARVKDIEDVVVPWLRIDHSRNFYNLSLDPYRELSENTKYGFTPHGSLLNWIDFNFGAVASFKDRTAGSWWNIINTAEDVFPKDVRSQVTLTRFPIGDATAGPQTHGGFSEHCFWRPAFWSAGRAAEKSLGDGSAGNPAEDSAIYRFEPCRK